MLDLAYTKIFQSTEKPLASTNVDNIVEGSPLISTVENGIGKVALGTGVNGEVFEGVAFAGFVRPTICKIDETFVVDADALAVTLKKVVVGAIGCYIDGVFATVKTTGDAAEGEPLFTAGTNTLTFAAADAGKNVIVVYSFIPSVAEARAEAGDGYAGGFSLYQLSGTIGVIHQGQVATDQYDAAVDWTEANISNIVINADGKFSRGSTGAKVTNARVLQAPGFGSTYLILQLL